MDLSLVHAYEHDRPFPVGYIRFSQTCIGRHYGFATVPSKSNPDKAQDVGAQASTVAQSLSDVSGASHA